MPNNAEHITLRYPEDTVLEISGNSEVIKQLVSHLDGVEIVLTTKYFGGK